MRKITVKNLIKFREKNELTKITFVKNLKKEKKSSEDSSGGDYWISCLSAIRNAFRSNNKNLLDQKIELLQDKIRVTESKRIKNQFQRNIDIINSFKDYDIQQLKPPNKTDLNFLKQPKIKSIIEVKGLPVEVKPCHIYTFAENNSDEIGGIWFVTQLKGFKTSELGMFVDMLYRYIEKHYSKDFYVNPEYCIAIDLFNGQEVRYSDIKNGDIPILIDITLEELKKI